MKVCAQLKNKILRTQIFIIGIATCLFLASCDLSNWPHRFSHGQVVPNAGIAIELPKPEILPNLYPRLVEVGAQGGYLHATGPRRSGGSFPLEEILSENYNGNWGYFRLFQDFERPDFRMISFTTEYNYPEVTDRSLMSASSVLFSYQRKGLGSFTKAEWIEFYRFYNEVLPRLFPEAEISIVPERHPAIFTDYEILLQIQDETDISIPIPAKYLTPDR